MSDKDRSPRLVEDAPHQPEATAPSSSSEPQKLHFPQIDLTTSLESLLKYSSNSADPTAAMPTRPNSPPALDESWTSLDVSDYTQEDDSRSETTDLVSLADLTSTNDSESIAEEDARSASSEELDTELATPEQSMHPLSWSKSQPTKEDENEDMEDTILLEKSAVQEVPTEVDVVYRRPLSYTNPPSDPTAVRASHETIRMTLSQHHLPQTGRPFRVAYFGTAAAREAQELVLGKVGAALIAADPQKASIDIEAPVYHVAPTEFSSGSKPYFTHLIPSQAQIIVDDITLLKEQQPGRIDIALKDGTILSSAEARKQATMVGDSWFPNLLVIHAAWGDVKADVEALNKVHEFARRHNVPAIMVSNNPRFKHLWLHDVRALHKVIEYPDGFDSPCSVDLDTFLNLDAEQLNRHLAFVCGNKQQSTREPLGTLSSLTRYLKSHAPWSATSDGTDEEEPCYVLQQTDSTQSIKASTHQKPSIPNLSGFQFGEVVANSTLRNCLAVVSFSILTWFLVVLIGDTFMRLYAPEPSIKPISVSNTPLEPSSSPPVVALASTYSSALTTSTSKVPKVVDSQPWVTKSDEAAPLAKNIWDMMNVKSSNADVREDIPVIRPSTEAQTQDYEPPNDVSATLRWLTYKSHWLFNSTQASLAPAFDQVTQLLGNVSLHHQRLFDVYQNKVQEIDTKVADELSRLQDKCQNLSARVSQSVRAKADRWNDLIISIQDKSNRRFQKINREQQRILHQAQKQVNKLARDAKKHNKCKKRASRWWRRKGV